MADKFDYASYLANLLIIQYHNKPKAVATIKAIGSLFPVDLILQIRDAFNIDTATGACLDVIGKYVGVTRWYYNDEGEQIRLNDEEYRILIKFKAYNRFKFFNTCFSKCKRSYFNKTFKFFKINI